jgi:hypothetical protein
MSTRAKVEEAIKAIEDKGKNTAKEVRTVLTMLLDYTENKPVNNSLDLFDYVTNSPLTNSTGSTLQYSCRGIRNHIANFTFKLKISDDSDNNVYTFNLKDNHANELLTTVNSILTTNNMQFSIPFNVRIGNLDNPLPFTIPTFISFIMRDNVPAIQFNMDFFVPGQQNSSDIPLTDAQAYTSVCFHSSQNID